MWMVCEKTHISSHWSILGDTDPPVDNSLLHYICEKGSCMASLCLADLLTGHVTTDGFAAAGFNRYHGCTKVGSTFILIYSNNYVCNWQ